MRFETLADDPYRGDVSTNSVLRIMDGQGRLELGERNKVAQLPIQTPLLERNQLA